jgi:hypothetical protein
MTLECEQAKQMLWTPGVGKTLRMLGDALMKTEYNESDIKSETRTDPQLMIVDMNTGSTILLKTTPHEGGKTDGSGYVRYPDYEQSNPMRVPPTLKEAVMLDKMAGMLDGRITASIMREIVEAMSEANELRLSNDKEAYKHWVAEHSKYPEQLNDMLEEFRQMTIKNQKGDTLIQMQAIPHMVAMASVSAIQDMVAEFIVEQSLEAEI